MNRWLYRIPMSFCVAAWALAGQASLADPPARTGRISFLQGEVSFFADRAQGWQPAALNYPVSSENSLWTEAAGRAEVRIAATALRLEERSVLDFSSVGDDETEIFLQRGGLAIRARSTGIADLLRVRTDAGQWLINGAGRFRIDVAADGTGSRFTVFSGRAYWESAGRRTAIDAGTSLVVTGTELRYEPAADSALDQWAQARDLQWDAAHARVVREAALSPYMTGYEELDANGTWVDDQDYGRLWSPGVVVADWAPYRYGHWAWVEPWGWTWIDAAAWGFAPFHYGRWVFLRARWWWWPGPRLSRPIYAPALVSWYGHPGWRTHRAFDPAVSWCPLAPREHFIPYYAHGNAYLHRINNVDAHVVIAPPRVYVNQNAGLTEMKHLRPVPQAAVHRPLPAPPERPRMAVGETPPQNGGRGTNEIRPVTRPLPAPANGVVPRPQPEERVGRRPEPVRVAPQPPAIPVVVPIARPQPEERIGRKPEPVRVAPQPPAIPVVAPIARPQAAPPRMESRPAPPPAPHPPAAPGPAPAHGEKQHPVHEAKPPAEGRGTHP